MVLGSDVFIDDPENPGVVTRLQVRNMRISVINQKTNMLMELYKHDQPIEHYNASIVAPVKLIRETKHEETKKEEDNSLEKWTDEMSEYQEKDSATVETLTTQKHNYVTGIAIYKTV